MEGSARGCGTECQEEGSSGCTQGPVPQSRASSIPRAALLGACRPFCAFIGPQAALGWASPAAAHCVSEA